MKILLTTDTVGGVWTYATDLAGALGSSGVKIALATMGPRVSASQRGQVEALANVTLYESTFKLEWMDEPWDDVRRAGEWLLEIEREFRPDVIHLNGYAHGSRSFAAPVLVVGHSCVLSWWRACKGEAAPAAWKRYRLAVTAGLRGADLVVAPTRAMMAALQRHYGPLPRSIVVRNGRREGLYSAGEAKEPLILSAGRLWDEAKNLAALEAVAGRLSWPIHVAGDDRRPVRRSDVVRQVRLLGQLNEADLAAWYRRAAIYALPARYEPFGLSVLEAALSGCSLVLGDISSLRENWDGAAEFVPPDDHAALERAIDRLTQDSAYRTRLSRTAASRARPLTALACARNYQRIYRQLSAGSRQQRRVTLCAS